MIWLTTYFQRSSFIQNPHLLGQTGSITKWLKKYATVTQKSQTKEPSIVII